MKTHLITLTAVMAAAFTIKPHAATAEVLPGVAAQPATCFYTEKPYDADLDAYVFNYRSLHRRDISRLGGRSRDALHAVRIVHAYV